MNAEQHPSILYTKANVMKKSTAVSILVVLFLHTLSLGQSKDQGTALQPLPGLMEDVRSLEKSSNLERLAAIKRMLEKR